MARTITGAQAVIDVLQSMGLPAPQSISDSQDPTVRQMWALATEVGQMLLTEFDWQILGKEWVINLGVTPGPAFDLPADLQKFYVDAQWNRTTRLPMLGSLTEQEWQMIKARNLDGTTFALLFRVDSGKMELQQTVSSAQTIVLPYMSRNWVREPATSNGRDYLVANDDIILFDPQLFKAKLKLEWLAEKKFDTTRQNDIYTSLLEAAKNIDRPARTLSMKPGGDYPYLGILNVPDTRYGS